MVLPTCRGGKEPDKGMQSGTECVECAEIIAAPHTASP
jgi:hypothetical protein